MVRNGDFGAAVTELSSQYTIGGDITGSSCVPRDTASYGMVNRGGIGAKGKGAVMWLYHTSNYSYLLTIIYRTTNGAVKITTVIINIIVPDCFGKR